MEVVRCRLNGREIEMILSRRRFLLGVASIVLPSYLMGKTPKSVTPGLLDSPISVAPSAGKRIILREYSFQSYSHLEQPSTVDLLYGETVVHRHHVPPNNTLIATMAAGFPQPKAGEKISIRVKSGGVGHVLYDEFDPEADQATRHYELRRTSDPYVNDGVVNLIWEE